MKSIQTTLLTCLLLLLGLYVQAQNSDRQFISAKVNGNILQVETSDGTITISPYSETNIEVEFHHKALKKQTSNAVIAPLYDGKVVFKETDKNIQFSLPKLQVAINKSPFKISYYNNNEYLLSEEGGFFTTADKSGFRFNIDESEKLMGGGERALGMNRRGHRLQLYNRASYGYGTHAELMYYSMPLIISSKKYMIGFDNGASGWLDLGASEENILQFEAVGGRMSYFIVAADTWQDLTHKLTDLTGRQPMLPRWALGNISSRMGYHSQNEVESVIDKYQEDEIPLDGIVLDLYWFGPDLTGHMGNLEWYRDSFPEPELILKRNKEKGIKTVLITEPFILKNSGKYKECAEQNLLGTDSIGNPYIFDFFFGTTALLDIFKPEAQDWFWSIYKKHTLSGVDGWWGDLGEPEVHPDDLLHVNGRADEVHNLYGHEWAKTISEGYNNDFAKQRPVILMRSGFIGSQRYGLVPWSGDVSRSWAGLQSQVEISLQMGMQGLAYMHSDLGGFAGDYEDAELYTRWLQYGVFQPIYRTHAQEDVPPEPIYWDDATKDIVRKYIELRYELMPYNYSLMHKNSVDGTPLMQPLFYIDDTPELLDETKTYLWGDNFLVSPVVEKGVDSQSVYLPKGYNWINYFTGETFVGGQTIDVSFDINTIPVFVKAGSFIPMTPVFSNMEEYTTDKLFVHYYHDNTVSNASGTMYTDDGKTKGSYQNNQFETITFEYKDNSEFIISAERHQYENMPKQRNIELIVHNYDGHLKRLTISGKKFKTCKSIDKFNSKEEAVYFDKQSGCMHIKIIQNNKDINIVTK